jgi:hypothetical protein
MCAAVRDRARVAAPRTLRRLDDLVLGPPGSVRPVWRGLLRGLLLGVRLVLVLLALVLLTAVTVVVLRVDETGRPVRRVMALAWRVAGPSRAVFDLEQRPWRAAANYGLGAGGYLLAAALVGRLRTTARRPAPVPDRPRGVRPRPRW